MRSQLLLSGLRCLGLGPRRQKKAEPECFEMMRVVDLPGTVPEEQPVTEAVGRPQVAARQQAAAPTRLDVQGEIIWVGGWKKMGDPELAPGRYFLLAEPLDIGGAQVRALPLAPDLVCPPEARRMIAIRTESESEETLVPRLFFDKEGRAFNAAGESLLIGRQIGATTGRMVAWEEREKSLVRVAEGVSPVASVGSRRLPAVQIGDGEDGFLLVVDPEQGVGYLAPTRFQQPNGAQAMRLQPQSYNPRLVGANGIVAEPCGTGGWALRMCRGLVFATRPARHWPELEYGPGFDVSDAKKRLEQRTPRVLWTTAEPEADQ